MRALSKRFVTLLLVLSMLTMGLPLSAFASADTASGTSIVQDLTDVLGTSESAVVTDDEAEDAAEEDEEGEDEEDAEPAEEQLTAYSVTVDEDGQVVSQESAGAMLSVQSTEAADGSDASSEVSVVDTSTTYTLDISVSTTAASSSNSAVKTVKVSQPVLTTTTTTTYSDGSAQTSSSTATYTLTVKVAVRGYGWQTASLSGSTYTYTASKASSGYYVSAIRITPSDELASALDAAGITFRYRVTTAYFGTLGWAKPGWAAGTIDNSCAATAIELAIMSTADASSYSTANRYISKAIVTYKTRKSGSTSWSSAKTNGATSGSSSWTSGIGTFAVKLSSSYSFSGGITYSLRRSTSDSDSNWSVWKSDYVQAGTVNSKIKAIKIKLTGEIASYYDVYYRVYVKGIGWLGWAKNGAKAGTKNTSYNISAIQVKLVPKGQSAPGSTSYSYVSSSTTKMKMVLKAQSCSSSTKYLILVDRSACRIGIFTGKKGSWTLKYYWECCVGKSSTPTVAGSFTVGSKGYSFGTSSYTCYYYTQFYGNYLFHSVLYYAGTKTIKDGTMGKAVSHGCVRLTISHAKWIYSNIPKKTKVYIY